MSHQLMVRHETGLQLCLVPFQCIGSTWSSQENNGDTDIVCRYAPAPRGHFLVLHFLSSVEDAAKNGSFADQLFRFCGLISYRFFLPLQTLPEWPGWRPMN